MAFFYCVGFPELSRSWDLYGHVSCHPVYTNKLDAEKANEGKITMIHEFYVRDSLLAGTVERLTKQRENMLKRFDKIVDVILYL
jgi:hypothetical protein